MKINLTSNTILYIHLFCMYIISIHLASIINLSLSIMSWSGVHVIHEDFHPILHARVIIFMRPSSKFKSFGLRMSTVSTGKGKMLQKYIKNVSHIYIHIKEEWCKSTYKEMSASLWIVTSPQWNCGGQPNKVRFHTKATSAGKSPNWRGTSSTVGGAAVSLIWSLLNNRDSTGGN